MTSKNSFANNVIEKFLVFAKMSFSTRYSEK